ncbi:hypothetical protein NDU88_004525 [Pleurodeles waltl]|uniref:Uncharacterized protein n=1 Tax=Pleurodeles waltl TaxID=8319 RepID=A0AAV7T8D6_PLEWA|nr:hypothetical protein NDU88_004525 [Pleurodeles waltl]
MAAVMFHSLKTQPAKTYQDTGVRFCEHMTTLDKGRLYSRRRAHGHEAHNKGLHVARVVRLPAQLQTAQNLGLVHFTFSVHASCLELLNTVRHHL